MWKGVITNSGAAVLARWTEGKRLAVTGAAAGTGRVSELAMLAQTGLVNKKQDASVLGSGATEQGQKLQIQLTPPAQGYALHQIGVYGALEGEATVLLALFQTDTDAGVDIPSESDVPDFVYTFYALVAVGNTGELEVTTDTSALASMESAKRLASEAVDKVLGKPSGAATLGEDGKVPESQLPALGVSAEAVNEAVSAHDESAGAHGALFAKKQDKITAKGVLAGDGNGGVSAKGVDSSPTAGSENLVTSGGVKAALGSKADLVDGKVPESQLPAASVDMEAVTTAANEAVAAHDESAEAHGALFAKKQDKITAKGVLAGDGNGGVSAKGVDSSPTAGSENLVTSGGVKSALGSKADLVDGKVPESQLPEMSAADAVSYGEVQALSDSEKTRARENINAASADDVYTKEETDVTVQDAINRALAAEMQEKTVTPSAATQTVTPDDGVAGLSKVTVEGDSDLVPVNIRAGVNVFGVTGTLEEGVEATFQEKTVTPTGEEIEVMPDSGYDGLSKVTVEGDENLVSKNVRRGVTIYGVEGSYSGSSSGGGTTVITGVDESEIPAPADYQTYVAKAKTVYTGSYEGMMVLDGDGYIGVCFFMSDFAVSSYDTTTTKMSLSGAVYCRYKASEGTWEMLDYREEASDGGHYALNIKFCTRTLYCGSQQVYPVTFSYGSAHVYGVEWYMGTGDTLIRTDDAASFDDPVAYMSGAADYGSPFDDLLPWSGMQVSERSGGKMVAIPKFWYKITDGVGSSGTGLRIQIADAEVDGFSVSPAHMDRGDGLGERDVVYIGRYHCRSSDYRSYGGSVPKASITRSVARTNIAALGNSIWQSDFAMMFTIWLLYIVEYANWNSQAVIGYGCGNNSSAQSMGYTDDMPYHTGTTLSSRTSYGCSTQYRNIEGYWDNVLDWVDGSYNSSSGLNIILNPNSFSDSSGGVAVGTPYSGYPKSYAYKNVAGAFPLFISSSTTAGDSDYSLPDYWLFGSSNPCLYRGGSCDQYQDRGMFCLYCIGSSGSSSGIGCRLMELP